MSIKLYGKEVKREEIKNFMKENYQNIRKYEISKENTHIFIWKPQNNKPKPRPVKDPRVVPGLWNPIKEQQKLINLTDEESRSLLIKGDKQESKEVDKSKKVNLCTYLKADGGECRAKLKHGNCYCIRHMKMVERRTKTQENLKNGS